MASVRLKVGLRSFKRNPRYQRLAHDGAELLVTKRGKPYLRVLAPPKRGSFLGPARSGKPLTAEILKPAIPPEAWRAGR